MLTRVGPTASRPATKPAASRPRPSSRGRAVVVAGLFGGKRAPAASTSPKTTAPRKTAVADDIDDDVEASPPIPGPSSSLYGAPPPPASTYDPAALAPASQRAPSGAGVDAYHPYVQPPLPPLPPSHAASRPSGGGPPAWLWVGVGVVLATVYQKVTSFFRGGGAQQAAANMMMQQMMKQASKQGGGAGAPPFPGFPGGAGAAPPFGFPPAAGAGPPFGVPPAFDTTATPAPSAGSKFEAVKAREEAARAAAAASSSAPSPPSTSAPPTEAPKKPAASAFRDVSDEPSPLVGGSSGGDGASTSSPEASASASGGGEAGSGEGKKKFSAGLVDQFFRDPSVQQMLYEHLPEPMRNPETFEWILSNPENRAQLEAMIEAQGASLDPATREMLGAVDADDVGKRLEAMGVSPADMMSKIMKEPELAAAMQKPKVMQAIMEMQSDPMAFMKYQSDADVMMVLNKLTAMFGPQAAAAGGVGFPTPPP